MWQYIHKIYLSLAPHLPLLYFSLDCFKYLINKLLCFISIAISLINDL
eukprot:UN00228